ncbi:DASS family sodium-coupled anion symporter [Parvularcula flava]|uniref:DASS family sodium-coupled anion symporter n=1 Tax=Aquisalinus luteolus TaxID=1566827 RepID=A0A8J3ERF5_9PROT|nr:DASS family sodium-coupled anion symporter [Aquisalinus luteolus]NHK28464.1 DASS family sodium-coupled anion symporter [Aquisalinus luteolus]GGH98555.1 sodium-dependent dicarboxylate transporter SdcS [Aquisalinus luteolus]
MDTDRTIGNETGSSAIRPAQRIGLIAGAVLFVSMLIIGTPDGLSRDAWVVASLTVLMATWWVTEAIPIPATALLPLVILPLSGVMPIETAAIPYAHRVVLLLMGGFIIAKSVERWNLHSRIALNIVLRAGNSRAGLIAGFMAASALLSMWISNTATTIMLAPIALSVSNSLGAEDEDTTPFAIAILLAVAWSASIGGLGTPIGTPTNLIVMSYLEQEFGLVITFDRWMMIGLPVVALLLPACWFVLTRWGVKLPRGTGKAGQAIIRQKLDALGPITTPEVRVLITFGCIASLWMFGRPLSALDIGGFTPFAGLNDYVTAILGAVVLFLIPSGSREQKGARLLDWETAVQIPWGVVLLFGGGLALAAAISATGLADWLGGQMSGVTALPLVLVMLAMVVFVIFATELTSNVATASALLPVIGAIAAGGDMNPLLLAAPVGMAASCAFMLPIATGPNAIVFASGKIPIARMAMIGFKLNVLAILIITLVVWLVAPLIFG